jgi:hypothetical protein
LGSVGLLRFVAAWSAPFARFFAAGSGGLKAYNLDAFIFLRKLEFFQDYRGDFFFQDASFEFRAGELAGSFFGQFNDHRIP